MTNERGSYGTMADRVAAALGHGSIEGMCRPPGPDPMARIGGAQLTLPTPAETATYRAIEPQHCHVDTPTGSTPGLLAEWRHVEGAGWEGRVVHLQLGDRGWRVVEAWVPAGRIEKA